MKDRTPRPAPSRRSASTATETSFPTVTGMPSRSGRRRAERNGCPSRRCSAPGSRFRRRVDAPGRAHTDRRELVDTHTRLRRRLADRECQAPATASGPPRAGCPGAPDRRRDHRARSRRPGSSCLPGRAAATSLKSLRTTSSSGRRFARTLHSSADRCPASRIRSGGPNVRTITGCSSSPSSSAATTASRRRSPFGHDASPRSMPRAACSGPHDLHRTRSAPCRRRRSRRPARRPGHSRGRRRLRERLDPLSAGGTTNVHGCRFDADPANLPASRIRRSTSAQRVAPVAPHVPSTRDREVGIHGSTLDLW